MNNIFKYFSKQKASQIDSAFKMQKYLSGGVSDLVIFDVGAYTGETALKYIKTFPDSSIYCFEPFPQSFQKLTQLSNSKLLKPYRIAFFDSIGTKKLHVNTDFSCNSFFPIAQHSKRYYPKSAENIETIEVNTTTIDHFCDMQGITGIDILKLDVEGSEIIVLKGAHNKLTNQEVSIIYTEVTFMPHYENACLFHELASFLGQYKYTLFNFHGLKSSKNGQLRWGNAIFLSHQKRTQFESASFQTTHQY